MKEEGEETGTERLQDIILIVCFHIDIVNELIVFTIDPASCQWRILIANLFAQAESISFNYYTERFVAVPQSK